MKKLYLLLLFCCLGFATIAQTTVTIFATAIAGTYLTGNANNLGPGTRTDNNIVSSGANSRGYAVFDISSIPAGATITSCVIGFTVSNYVGGGAPSGWNTYGYAGSLVSVTTPATLFADMVAGTSLSTQSYGTGTGNVTLVSTPASVAFIQANIGSTPDSVSICWTGGGSKIYTITGETGAATTAGGAPYLQITYTCAGISGVSASAAPNPLCVGSPLTLTGIATGATSYSWSGPGPYTSAAQSPTLITNASSAGVYTFTAYNAAGCGIAATTAAVVLNTTPVSSITPAGSAVTCASEGMVLLTGPVAAPDTYQWYLSGAPISGATNQTFTAINSGSYTLEITDPTSGCANMSSPTVVNIIPASPPLNPSGNAHICLGSYTTLSVDITGITTGITYQWEVGGVGILGAVNSTYTTGTAGVYNCVLTLPTCSITSQFTSLTIEPLPTPVVSYHSGELSTSNLYTSYEWFLNLVSIPGATSSTYVPMVDGSYRVRVTDTNGCSNNSAAYSLNNLGVQQVNNVAIKIYPNPATQMVHIASAEPLHAVISSIEGKRLIDSPLATDIDINELPGGLYLIALYNEAGERVMTDKLIKE